MKGCEKAGCFPGKTARHQQGIERRHYMIGIRGIVRFMVSLLENFKPDQGKASPAPKLEDSSWTKSNVFLPMRSITGAKTTEKISAVRIARVKAKIEKARQLEESPDSTISISSPDNEQEAA
jgi:hypothetical protein